MIIKYIKLGDTHGWIYRPISDVSHAQNYLEGSRVTCKDGKKYLSPLRISEILKKFPHQWLHGISQSVLINVLCVSKLIDFDFFTVHMQDSTPLHVSRNYRIYFTFKGIIYLRDLGH